MADNTIFHASLDPAMPKIADYEVEHSGDNAKVQAIQLVQVLGSEGSRTLLQWDVLEQTLQALKEVPVYSTGAAVVANGATDSSAIDLGRFRNWGFIVPNEFDGTQIQFQVSHDGTSWFGLYDILNARVTMTVAVLRAYDIPGELLGWRWVKISTVTAQTGSTQFAIVMKS